jgi:hypothetical protein
MTDRPTNEELEAMIAEARSGTLEPDEAAELPLLSGLLADPSTWAEPGPGVEDLVVQAVAEAPPVAVTSVVPAGGSSPGRAPIRRQRMFAALVAVAAVIAIIVSVVLANRGSSGPDYQARLAATALAPGAHATTEITKTSAGFRVNLDAHGLPALHGGEYYQAWLKDAAGTLVPIGTFSSSDGRVTLWSGVSPRRFPTLSVTIESRDNDQGSSGRRVLIGDVHAG